jgi:hypothetical protein
MIFFPDFQKMDIWWAKIFGGHFDGQNLKRWANAHQNRYSGSPGTTATKKKQLKM